MSKVFYHSQRVSSCIVNHSNSAAFVHRMLFPPVTFGRFWCFSAFLLWTGISSKQRSSDESYPFTFCFKSEPTRTFSSICTMFWTADWSGVFWHSTWISRCDKATFFYFLDQRLIFPKFCSVNKCTNHYSAELMSRLSPRTTTTTTWHRFSSSMRRWKASLLSLRRRRRVYPKPPLCWRAWWWSLQVGVKRTSLKCPGKMLLWICLPVFLSQTCVEHLAPLCHLFVRHLLRKGLKTAKVCLFYLHASVSLGQQWTCCWFSRRPCQDRCWRYYLPHLGTASVGNALPQSWTHH